MKAYDPKKRLTPAQRNLINTEVINHFDKIQEGMEKVIHDRVAFMFLIALGEVATEQLHFGAERRARLIENVIKTANKISDDLTSNTCEDGNGNKGYDVEYNRELLSRLANAYGIKFDESIFDDNYLEGLKDAV